ncbi:MAG: sigma-E processing peptidase SpoIIGA, partial [Lachnospiraceae bacterium]|nr:sigma-E processing peptidase SpoIIGA [Lachnospiraceae bacterium]
LYLYITAFLSGGILNAVYFYTNFQMILKGMNFVTFLVFSAFSYLIMNYIIHIIKIKMGRTGAKQDIIKVILCHRGTSQTVNALFDSGNSLKEPISGSPVHIVDYETADNLLKKSHDIQEKISTNEEISTNEKIRIIPYNSLGKKNGLMTAFECERVVINIRGTEIDTGPAYLGIYQGELCAKGKYKMILNRSIDTWL